MRGDLVYEKLGEIDPELLTDALPPAAVTPPLYQLGSNQSMRPPRAPRVRKVVLICACILLAGLLLAGGTVALSRAWEGFLEETTPEDHFGKELTYGGPVSIEGFGSLTGSDEMEVIGNELMGCFTAAAPVEDVCECERDVSIQFGDTLLTYNRDHGCFRNGDTGEVYQLREQDKEYVNDLLDDLLPLPHILTFFYEYNTLRHGDDFVFSVGWWEGYGSIYKIDKVYLRYEGEDTEYVTPGFFTVEDQTTYRIRIKDDAPYGKYTLVAHVYSPYTGRNIEMEIPSVSGAIEILPGEPAYTFTESMTHEIYNYGDTIFVNAAMINNGDPILRWTIDPSILPEVSLRSVTNGKTYPMISEQESDLPGRVIKLNSGESSVGIFYLEFTSSMPLGVYDLVITFEDHTQVFENAVAVMDPDKDCSYDISFTVTDTGDERTLKLYVTLHGKDIYRYGSSTCFAPDSVFLICEDDNTTGMIVPELTAVNDGPIVEDGLRIRHWREGESMSFTYTFQIDLEDEINGTIPGVHDLVVHYKGEESAIYEDALIVVAP